MKNIYRVGLLSLFMSVLAHAATISGTKAQQLYELSDVAAKIIDSASVKNIDAGIQCYEQMLPQNSPYIVYEYVCTVPDSIKDERIRFVGEVAKSLYVNLGRKGCTNKLRTRQNVNTMTRTLWSMECQELDYIGGKTEYVCIFKL